MNGRQPFLPRINSSAAGMRRLGCIRFAKCPYEVVTL